MNTLESFGEWLPDQPALNNPGCTECINFSPIQGGYREIDKPSLASSDGLTNRCRGAYNGIFDGDSVIFAGDSTKLYSLTSYGGAWNDDSGSAYSVSNFWDFTQFGSLVLAVNGGTSANDPPQVWDMSSDVPGTDNWASLGGSPPNAATITVINQHVVVGCTYDATDGEVEDRVRWCGFGDAGSWAIDAATGADIQDLNNGGGKIQQITSNNNQGWIYQERAISKIRYVGSPLTFEIDKNVFGDLGVPSGKSVVTANGIDYMWSTIGFIAIGADGSREFIGSQKVDRYFADQLAAGDEEHIVGAHDPANYSVVWLYGHSPTTDTTSAIAYNYKMGQWYEMSFTNVATNLAFNSAQFIFPAKLSNQAEQKLYISTGDGTTPDHVLYSLEDDTGSMLGTITTREYEFNPGGRTLFGRMHIMSDYEASFTVQISCLSRDSQQSASTNSTSMGQSLTDMEHHTLVNARYHRFRAQMSARSGKFGGYEIREFSRAGRF